VFPLVTLVTAAGILSLGLAVLTSWALMMILLLIVGSGTEPDHLQRQIPPRLQPVAHPTQSKR